MKRLLLPLISLISLFIACESQAAITFVNGSHASSASAASVTPAEPTNCAENDFILAYFMWDDSPAHSNTVTDPADFTEIDQADELTGSDSHWYAGWKLRGSDAGSGYAFSVGTADTAQGTLLCFRGKDTTTPLDVTWVRATHFKAGNNQPNGNAKAITTVSDNAMVVIVHMLTSNLSDGSAGPPTNYTTAFTAELTTGSRGVDSAYRIITSASTETPGNWTHTDTNGTADSRNFTLALREATSTAAAVRRRVAP